jgi:hypothetical protein
VTGIAGSNTAVRFFFFAICSYIQHRYHSLSFKPFSHEKILPMAGNDGIARRSVLLCWLPEGSQPQQPNFPLQSAVG